MRYPLYREARARIHLPSGRPITDVTREQLQAGRLAAGDLGIHEDTLREQARIAEEAGFAPLARNLERAAELTRAKSWSDTATASIQFSSIACDAGDQSS